MVKALAALSHRKALKHKGLSGLCRMESQLYALPGVFLPQGEFLFQNQGQSFSSEVLGFLAASCA